MLLHFSSQYTVHSYFPSFLSGNILLIDLTAEDLGVQWQHQKCVQQVKQQVQSDN